MHLFDNIGCKKLYDFRVRHYAVLSVKKTCLISKRRENFEEPRDMGRENFRKDQIYFIKLSYIFSLN